MDIKFDHSVSGLVNAIPLGCTSLLTFFCAQDEAAMAFFNSNRMVIAMALFVLMVAVLMKPRGTALKQE